MTMRPDTEPAVKKPGTTRLPAEPLRLDRLIRARAIHSKTGETYRSVGLRGAEIAAMSGEPDGLGELAWHESNLAENRLPTGAELDAAAPDNRVLAQRGEQLAIADTATLTAVGAGPATPDPPGGKFGRLPDGRLDDLAGLTPAFTIVGGRAVHDLGGVLAA